MNFKLDDNSLEKITDIFDHTGKVLNIDLDHYLYDGNNGITYLKTKVSNETCFKKGKDKTVNTILYEKTKCNCRVLLQINLFTTIIMKMKIIILKYFYKVVDVKFLPIID